MMIRPILSAMLRNKTGPILISLQIAITLAIVANAAFIINERFEKMNRPTGMDDRNLVFAQSSGFGPGYDHYATMQADLEALRALPGVANASYMSRPPLTGGGSSTTLSPTPETDSDDFEATAYWSVGYQGIETLGLKIIEGRSFEEADIRREDETKGPGEMALITKAYAEDLFGEESAVGKLMYTGLGQPLRIIGVIEHMQGAWVGWERLDRNTIYPLIGEPPNLTYAIRVEPGLADSMVPTIEAKLQEINRDRVVTRVWTLRQYMERSYRNDSAMVKMLAAVSALLIAVTALGIVGLAAFNVNQRRKQIGTRRALGAQRSDILRYFLTEALLITFIGAVLGTILAFGMSWWLGTQFNVPKMDWWYVPPAFAALIVIGVLAVLGPARRATLISPALATRSV